MELILKSNNEQSIAKIIALAKKLNVIVEKKDANAVSNTKDLLKERILNFKSTSSSSFGDAAGWEKEQRERNLIISEVVKSQSNILDFWGKIKLDDRAF